MAGSAAEGREGGEHQAASPQPASALRAQVRAARQRSDWAALLDHANALREAAPDSADGYLFAAAALRHLNRRAELRDLLAEARRRFPDHPKLRRPEGGRGPKPDAAAAPERLRREAQAALDAKDWAALAVASADLRAAVPDDPIGFQLGTRALREQKRLRQAEAVSRDGVERFADHPALLLERAMVLQRQKQLEPAAACYERLRELRPDMRLAWSRHASMTILLGRFDDAEAMIEAGLKRFPGDVELLVQRAIAAMRRQDFALARARWEDVRAVAPDDRRLKSFGGDLALAEQLHLLPEDAAAAADELGAETPAALDAAGVFKRFEGMGGNCEFGLAQRAAGIEPLGLLRFAATSATKLAEMLEAGFEGVGEAAQTTLTLNMQQEYMLEDRRFFRCHTFINYGETDEQVLLDKLRKRTAFLRDKLIAELRKGSKLFIFRPADGVFADGEIARLHRAMRSFGPGELVCVRDTAPGEVPVSVTRAAEGLLLATMPGHNAKLNLAFVEAERFAHWLTLCRLAIAAAQAN